MNDKRTDDVLVEDVKRAVDVLTRAMNAAGRARIKVTLDMRGGAITRGGVIDCYEARLVMTKVLHD